MQDSNTETPNEQAEDAEATSKETLADLKNNEQDSESDTHTNEPPLSPDGTLDDPGETNDAGPM